jgi:hypothetical protein
MFILTGILRHAMQSLAVFGIFGSFSAVGPQLANAGSKPRTRSEGKDDGIINRISEGLLFA